MRIAFLKLLSWAQNKRFFSTDSNFSARSTGFLDGASLAPPPAVAEAGCDDRIQLASLDTSGRPVDASKMDACSQRRISLSLADEHSESRGLDVLQEKRQCNGIE